MTKPAPHYCIPLFYRRAPTRTITHAYEYVFVAAPDDSVVAVIPQAAVNPSSTEEKHTASVAWACTASKHYLASVEDVPFSVMGVIVPLAVLVQSCVHVCVCQNLL